jgi:hypothetical protein
MTALFLRESLDTSCSAFYFFASPSGAAFVSLVEAAFDSSFDVSFASVSVSAAAFAW